MLRTLSSTVILALCTAATVYATDATGRTYYQHYCAACHGRSGKGGVRDGCRGSKGQDGGRHHIRDGNCRRIHAGRARAASEGFRRVEH